MIARGPESHGFDAAIFDMDGLLVDSEPLWHEAEISVLGALGVPLVASACRQTKGMFVNEVTEYWYERYPWTGPTPDQTAVQVVDAVMGLVVAKGELKPGVRTAIDLCQAHGLPLAIASSSEYRLIDLVLGHFDLGRYFAVTHSAEEEPFGKPHPGVYLSAAAKVGARRQRCLAWEDAPAGVLAAKAAGMLCVAVPEPAERRRPEMGLADALLGSLEEVDEALWQRLEGALLAGSAGGSPGEFPTGASSVR
jgi:mannitol-1-/sugar-/sorbitol-6-/2-deoxyglucose-6-phosphatase